MTGLGQIMRTGGYATHFIGKWDAGHLSWCQMPAARGYDSFVGYLSHTIDYWTFEATAPWTPGHLPGITDFWQSSVATQDEGPALQLLNGANCSHAQQRGCQYVDAVLETQVYERLNTHNMSRPLFLFWSLHANHDPIQPPDDVLEELDQMPHSRRSAACFPSKQTCSSDAGSFCTQFRRHLARVYDMDSRIGRVVKQLRRSAMWDNTLLVLSSDNGAPAPGPGSNWPLSGSKGTFWEGGLRVSAFVSGGYLPAEKLLGAP